MLRDLPVRMAFIGTGYAASDDMKSLILPLVLEDRVTPMESVQVIGDTLKQYSSS